MAEKKLRDLHWLAQVLDVKFPNRKELILDIQTVNRLSIQCPGCGTEIVVKIAKITGEWPRKVEDGFGGLTWACLSCGHKLGSPAKFFAYARAHQALADSEWPVSIRIDAGVSQTLHPRAETGGAEGGKS